MHLQRAYQMDSIEAKSIVDTAQDFAINDRVFMISNAGAQPAYFNPAETATTSSFLIPANTTLPQYFSCPGNLSVISNGTGTTVCVLYLDV